MNILDAACKVLSAERRPMSAEELTRRIVDGGMWYYHTGKGYSYRQGNLGQGWKLMSELFGGEK